MARARSSWRRPRVLLLLLFGAAARLVPGESAASVDARASTRLQQPLDARRRQNEIRSEHLRPPSRLPPSLPTQQKQKHRVLQATVTSPPHSSLRDTAPTLRHQEGAAYLQGLDGNFFRFDGLAEQSYALLVQHEDGVAVVGRFARAYTTGVAFINNTITPYKPKGTWIKSLAIQVKDWNPNRGIEESSPSSSSLLLVASSSTAFPSPDIRLRYGSLQTTHSLSSIGTANSAPLLSVKVLDDEDADIVTIAFESKVLDGKVLIVPPHDSWCAVSCDDKRRSSLSHLNLVIDRLSASNVQALHGILGASASGNHPSDTLGHSTFDAAHFVEEDLINRMP